MKAEYKEVAECAVIVFNEDPKWRLIFEEARRASIDPGEVFATAVFEPGSVEFPQNRGSGIKLAAMVL